MRAPNKKASIKPRPIHNRPPANTRHHHRTESSSPPSDTIEVHAPDVCMQLHDSACPSAGTSVMTAGDAAPTRRLRNADLVYVTIRA